ncbi:MAG: DUF3221 domain-containing protein [Culicoidibacterales bacterium]
MKQLNKYQRLLVIVSCLIGSVALVYAINRDRFSDGVISGRILSCKQTETSATIIVQSDNPKQQKYSLASIGIDISTQIWKFGMKQEIVDLEVGQWVTVYFVGPVAESFPVQTNAKYIEINKDR